MSVLVAICSGSRCWKHRRRVGGLTIWESPLQQWVMYLEDKARVYTVLTLFEIVVEADTEFTLYVGGDC